jgi:hypothetical protein
LPQQQASPKSIPGCIQEFRTIDFIAAFASSVVQPRLVHAGVNRLDGIIDFEPAIEHGMAEG